jgi:glycosyltransferase involved in cell wall biosynthesis
MNPAAPEACAPIRIVRIITRLNIGGPSIQAIELTTRLSQRGFETLLVHGSLGAGEGDMRYLLEGRSPGAYDVVSVPALRRELVPLDDVHAARRLFSLMRRFRPHLVHTHMAKAGTLGRLAAVAYNRSVSAAARARLVHTYHGHVLEGYFGPARTTLFIGIERALARATDRIVTISPRIRDDLLRHHRIGRDDQYRVVPLGFDLGPFARIGDGDRAAARAALRIDAGAPVVATVGRLTAIKQQHLFLAVCRQVVDRQPSAVLLIAGDGELRTDLETEARRLGIADRVRFLGWERDLARLYAATDVFLLTSRNEGTPVALIEAMAAGCAGVSTDVGGVRDVIADDRTGRLAPFGDVGALAAHVLDLLDDCNERRRVGSAGRSAVVERFAIERLVHDVEAVYRELLR